MTKFDERDAEILAERVKVFDDREGPRVGDYVVFSDSVTRRISYIWRDEHGTAFDVQTSTGGSYYLGKGYVSMSGSLFGPVKPETLVLTDEKRNGDVWFFHHDFHEAHNGVGAVMPFRVFTCSEVATT